MSSELIDTTDPRWRQALARMSHDVYHTPQYLAFSGRHEAGAPAAFHAEHGEAVFLAPLLVRSLPTPLDAPADWRDATTPYGYASPIISDPRDEDALDRLLTAFKDAARQAGIVSAFFRLHPLLPLSREVLDRHGHLEYHGETVFVDLTQTPDVWWQQTRANHRTGINRLRRAGYTVATDDWQYAGEFPALYRRTMERVSASPFYLFPDDYFHDLRASLGDALHLCTVLGPDGTVACAGLFMECDGLVQYHLGGTADAHLALAPSKLMFEVARGWFRDRGARFLHLGGGVGARDDALFHFKAGFAPGRASFHTYRMVVDEQRFDTLVERWHRTAAERPASDSFPPYRRGATPAAGVPTVDGPPASPVVPVK